MRKYFGSEPFFILFQTFFDQMHDYTKHPLIINHMHHFLDIIKRKNKNTRWGPNFVKN